MARSERTFIVARPVDVVYDHLADPANAVSWDVTVASVTADPHDPAGWDVLVAFYGKRIPFRVVRHEARRDAVLEYRGTNRAAQRRERFELTPCAEGTQVSHVAEVRLTGALRLLNKGLDSAFAALVAKSDDRLAAQLAEVATSR